VCGMPMKGALAYAACVTSCHFVSAATDSATAVARHAVIVTRVALFNTLQPWISADAMLLCCVCPAAALLLHCCFVLPAVQ